MNHTMSYALFRRGTPLSNLTSNLGEVVGASRQQFTGDLKGDINLISATDVHHVWISTNNGTVNVLVTDPVTSDIISIANGATVFVSEFATPVNIEVTAGVDETPMVDFQSISRTLSVIENPTP